MKFTKVLVLLLVLGLFAAACAGEADETTTTGAPTETTAATTTTTEATTTTEPMADVGTAENPIKVLFVPSVSAEDIITGGDLLRETLTAATGLQFEVSIGASYAATIEEMCASPANTIGFIPANGYVLANDLCGVEMVLKSVRFGYDVYWTQFIVPRDSDITSVEDLAGKKWAYPDATSTSGFLIPSGLFASLDLEITDSFAAGGHGEVTRAVYNGEADFGTNFYSPYINVDGESMWDDDPANADVTNFDDCGIVSATDAEGTFGEGDLVCGDVEIRDARREIRADAPNVIAKVKIISLSDPIPNDGMAFGPDFPQDLKDEIVAAVVDYATNDPDGFATAFDAYSWDNVLPTNDSEFDSIRALLQALNYGIDDF